MMGGGGVGLFKTLNRADVNCGLYLVFTCGEIDFVGGLTLMTFINDNIIAKKSAGAIGDVKLPVSTGEEVHAMLFDRQEMKTPTYWKEII